MVTSFRICHLSDLHFRSWRAEINAIDFIIKNARSKRTSRARDLITTLRYSCHDPVIAKYVAEFLYAKQNDYDTLLVSGDLSQTGSYSDLIEASQYFSPPYPGLRFLNVIGKPTLAFPDIDVFVTPGNHDRWQSDAGDAGGRLFEAVFRDWPLNSRTSTFVTKDLLSGDRLALIAVDFSLRNNESALPPSQIFCLGQGRVDSEALLSLKTETHRIQDAHPGIGVVWVSHFPPLTGPVGLGNSLKLIDDHLLLEAATDCSVELILAGHVHDTRSEKNNKVVTACAGCATVLRSEEGNWIRILEIIVESGRAHLSRKDDWRWSPVAKSFLPYPYSSI